MDRMLYVAMTGAKQTMLAQAINTNNLANANTGVRVSSIARHGSSVAVTRTGVSLNCGWPETGSRTASTSASAGPVLENARPQCMGRNTSPRRRPASSATRVTRLPWRLSTRTKPPSSRPRQAASCGDSSSRGSAMCADRRGDLPVRHVTCFV